MLGHAVTRANQSEIRTTVAEDDEDDADSLQEGWESRASLRSWESPSVRTPVPIGATGDKTVGGILHDSLVDDDCNHRSHTTIMTNERNLSPDIFRVRDRCPDSPHIDAVAMNSESGGAAGWSTAIGISSPGGIQLLLLSLPIDSLHCIASFLAPSEWFAFGRSNKAAFRVYREVIKRVRMHGFRCATEVITAWKLGQHADAKELSALYIYNGVPIYPISLGHSYHTLVWRMGIEANEMTTADQADGGGETSVRNSRARVDRFFTERSNSRAREEYGQGMTYVEEKCLFLFNQIDSSGAAGRNNNSRRLATANVRTQAGAAQQNVMPQQLVIGDPIDAPLRFPSFRPSGFSHGTGSLQSNLRSSSSNRSRGPSPTLKIHVHLLDQHVLMRPSVDDQDGAMRTNPVSLSADFFHPQFASKPAPQKFPASSQSVMCSTGSEIQPLWDGAASPSYMMFADEGFSLHAGTEGGNEAASAASGMINDLPSEDALIDLEQELDNLSPLGHSRMDEEAPSPEYPSFATEPLASSQVSHRSVLDDVNLEVYSASSACHKWYSEKADDLSDIKSHLRTRFSAYQRRLESLLTHNDHSGFEECILDLWDEFFPLTANFQYYDRHTAVPRVSGLHKFLTKPCPKAVGIVQCEIERIKINSKRKGVNMKGRFFPVYEYRLFIRHRPGQSSPEISESGEASTIRRDTILIAAKNRGRKHVDLAGVVPVTSSAKKGVNNYYLYMPQQADVDSHFNAVNDIDEPIRNAPNGASHDPVPVVEGVLSGLLGRLQSNIIGTEFQIFTPRVCKKPSRRTGTRSSNGALSSDEEDVGYDSGVSSDNASAASRRKNRFSRRMSLRRSSTNVIEQPTPIEEEISSIKDSRFMKRTGSWPVLAYKRSSRTSRRAIANTAGLTDTQHCQTVVCEDEDGAITYTANLLGNRPRIMDVCIPKVSSDGVTGAEWKRYLESCDDVNDASAGNRMLHRFKQLQQRLENHDPSNHDDTQTENPDGYVPPDDFGLLALQNRPPWWNIELGAFVLNFGGRVSVASVKNFQLCDRNDHDNIMLQFGRIHGRHSFTMDFQYPLTAVQAFAIAISSLQSKISFG